MPAWRDTDASLPDSRRPRDPARPAPSAAQSPRRRCVPTGRAARGRRAPPARRLPRRQPGGSPLPVRPGPPTHHSRSDPARRCDDRPRAPRSADRTDRSRIPSRHAIRPAAGPPRPRGSRCAPATRRARAATTGSRQTARSAYAKVRVGQAMKKLACGLVALAAVAVSAQVITPEQTPDPRSIGERGGFGFSPDGARLVFSVADPVKGTARARAIWLYDLASGQTRPLTFSGRNDSSPQWAPDGTSIAFLSDRDGASQIYRLPM